jgi:transcription termination/antitermination protein NusG
MNLRLVDCNWHVLFTLPNHENVVSLRLKKNGLDSFYPTKKEVRQWSDRKKAIIAPLLPNYVFVNTPSKERYKALEVPGVIRYLDSNRDPTIVPQHEIDLLMRMTGGNCELTSETFKRGDVLVISSGPLNNLEGVCIDSKGTKRLLVEIHSIRRSFLIDISTCDVKKVKDRQTQILV